MFSCPVPLLAAVGLSLGSALAQKNRFARNHPRPVFFRAHLPGQGDITWTRSRNDHGFGWTVSNTPSPFRLARGAPGPVLTGCNSYVWYLKAGFWGNAVGTYIEHCRIGSLYSLRLYLSRILKSHITGHRCKITTLV